MRTLVVAGKIGPAFNNGEDTEVQVESFGEAITLVTNIPNRQTPANKWRAKRDAFRHVLTNARRYGSHPWQ